MNNSFERATIAQSESSSLIAKKIEGVENVNQDKIQEVSLPVGTYHVRFGFPRIYSGDKRYYYGNRPKEMHSEPIKLDVDSKEFQSLITQYKGLVPKNSSLVEKIKILNQVIERSVRADAADQPIKKASEIIAQGKGACDSLVLVAGLILDQSGLLQDSIVERIIGASNAFSDERPHEINHAWLRISDGRVAVLYDPYYKNINYYDLTKIELVLEEGDPFYGYEVFALGAPDLSRVTGLHELKGPVRIVKASNGESEAWLARDHALAAQVTGEVDYRFNDAIEVQENVDSQAPRILVPIQEISKTD